MKYRIHYHQEVDATDLEPTLKQAALKTLRTENVEPGSLTVVLSTENTLRDLNHEFAGVDRPTDVLAFPGSEPDPDDEGIYFGDVIIALPIAQQQAAKAGHSVMEECALLVIHGTLHLLGYQHATPVEKEKMWSKQALIMKQLDLPPIEPIT